MAKKREPLLFLGDIATAIEKIEEYIQPGKDYFFQNEAIQDAVFFRLQTIGEAVNQLPEEMKVQYPDIRWKDIVGFRNILAHRYWRVDIDVVWGLFDSGGSLEQLKRTVHELIDQSS